MLTLWQIEVIRHADRDDRGSRAAPERRGARAQPPHEAHGGFAGREALFSAARTVSFRRRRRGPFSHKSTRFIATFENLQFAIGALERGKGAEFSHYPDLLIDLDILKIEDAIDFLLLGRGEVVAMTSRLEHPA